MTSTSFVCKSAVLAAISLLAANGQAANLVTNGSFESTTASVSNSFNGRCCFATLGGGSSALSGWDVIGSSIDLVNNSYWQAAAGSLSLDLSGTSAGGVRQYVPTTIGQMYQLTFEMAGNPYKDGSQGQRTMYMDVYIQGVGQQTFNFDATNTTYQNMGWVSKAFNFTAAATSTAIQFYSGNVGASGPTLDNISVTAVPEPGEWAMMLAGLGLIGVVGRRRSRTA